MYNETCPTCRGSGHEYLVDGECFSCVKKRIERLEAKIERVRRQVLDLVTLAGVTCALVDRCQLYGCADALRSSAAELQRTVADIAADAGEE